MIPRYLRSCVKLLLELTVILMFVFSTSSTTQCRPKTVETLRQGYVTIRNIGIKLCQLKCVENGACLNFEYNIETLTCRLSRDEPKKIKKKDGYISLPRSHSDVPTGACASKTCSLGLRCLVTRSGKAVCIQDGKQNYPERPPQHKVDKQETLKNNSLHDACKDGDLGRVRSIFSRCVVDVDSRDKQEGWTPLMIAALKGHRRIFDFLIRKGANVSQVDYYGNNILHMACQGGHVGMVKHVLSQCRVDINRRTSIGLTPLMKAAHYGYRNVFDYLAGMGANISLVDPLGKNILHLACQGGHVGMVKHVLSQCRVDINRRTRYGLTPLMKAAHYGYRNVFDYLAGMGANISLVDPLGKNILHLACQGGHVGMVKHVLSQCRVDINRRTSIGLTPLMKAAHYGYRNVFDYLAGMGANISLVDPLGKNILHLACQGGHVGMVKHVLSQCRVDINSRTRYGSTPLMIAAQYGHINLFDYLVRMGANISLVDTFGYNILHQASEQRHVEIVKHILSQNMVDINARDKEGYTAAMRAKNYRQNATYDLFVSWGCPVQ